MAQRHDGVRNLLTSLIGKVCTNAEVDPQLQPLDNERLNLRSAKQARRQEWTSRQGAFGLVELQPFFYYYYLCQSNACLLQV